MSPLFPIPDRTFIIAEAGVNHNGSLDMARSMIDAAVAAGADAVKFQLFDPQALTTSKVPMAQYQRSGGEQMGVDSQQALLARLALPKEAYEALQEYAQQKGILFLCTPFDDASAKYLCETLRLPYLKIASGEVTNLPFLKRLASYSLPIILSTGMSTLTEIEAAVAAIRSQSEVPLALLHCVSAYPAPVDSLNLKAIQTLKAQFPDCTIGFSDHSLGIHMSIVAVALGARIIEKHFTLDKTLPGPDHKASLSISELADLVSTVREVEQALGDGVKSPQDCERDCMQVARKSLVMRYNRPSGYTLTENDVVIKRPGTGLAPSRLEEVIGKRLKAPVVEDELLTLEKLEV